MSFVIFIALAPVVFAVAESSTGIPQKVHLPPAIDMANSFNQFSFDHGYF